MPKPPPLLSPPILFAVLLMDPPRLWANVVGSQIVIRQRKTAATMHTACQLGFLQQKLKKLAFAPLI